MLSKSAWTRLMCIGETNSYTGHLLHTAFKVILVLMFFMSPPPFFFLKSRLKGSKDEMLLDMINKLKTGVNVCSYTHWMTGCNWLQPVWCNKAHYYANPASPSDSTVVWVKEREKEKRQSRGCETERETEQMNGCVSVQSEGVCVQGLSVPLRSL